MGAGEDTDAHHVDVFLHCGLGHLVGGNPHAHVDHLHAGVSHGPGDHLDAPVMPVQPQLGQEDFDVRRLGSHR